MYTLTFRNEYETLVLSAVTMGKKEPNTDSEYERFSNLLRSVVSVPHSEIKRREQEYKEQRKKEKRPKTSDASRVSRDKD